MGDGRRWAAGFVARPVSARAALALPFPISVGTVSCLRPR